MLLFYFIFNVDQDVFENMDSAKLSLLKELLVRNSVRGTPPYSRVEETDAQGKKKQKKHMMMSGNGKNLPRPIFCRNNFFFKHKGN